MSGPGDADLRRILAGAKVIACVGVSANPVRPSHFVARYLALKGYRVIPVNPALGGAPLFGEASHDDLTSVDAPVDMIDVFRRSEHVPGVLEEALAHLPHLRTMWLQIGVRNEEAAARAEARGLEVVQDRCPKIERQRLFGELRMAGFATGVLSSKL